jgi:hypothetical protein
MNCISELHASFEDASWMYLEQEMRFFREPQVVPNRQRANEDCFNFVDREAAEDKKVQGASVYFDVGAGYPDVHGGEENLSSGGPNLRTSIISIDKKSVFLITVSRHL